MLESASLATEKRKMKGPKKDRVRARYGETEKASLLCGWFRDRGTRRQSGTETTLFYVMQLDKLGKLRVGDFQMRSVCSFVLLFFLSCAHMQKKKKKEEIQDRWAHTHAHAHAHAHTRTHTKCYFHSPDGRLELVLPACYCSMGTRGESQHS